MSDNEKIIAKLQDAAAYFRSGFDAMYGTVACEKYRNWTDAIEQAIALLKAQEAVVPSWRRGIPFCGKCGRQFGRGFKYCPDCGRAVKWE